MIRIFLIGPRASGKTSVGSRLADRLGYDFIDLDKYLCERECKSVEEIVCKDGWSKFRELESGVLLEVTQKNDKPLVIATGGGVVLASQNRNLLREQGRVIWLKADTGTLMERLRQNLNQAQRPSLTGKDPLTEICEVMKEREPLYACCAHHEIDAAKDIEAVCDEILKVLQSQ